MRKIQQLVTKSKNAVSSIAAEIAARIIEDNSKSYSFNTGKVASKKATEKTSVAGDIENSFCKQESFIHQAQQAVISPSTELPIMAAERLLSLNECSMISYVDNGDSHDTDTNVIRIQTPKTTQGFITTPSISQLPAVDLIPRKKAPQAQTPDVICSTPCSMPSQVSLKTTKPHPAVLLASRHTFSSKQH